MHTNHSFIAFVTGAVTVNVPTPMDNVFSTHTMADLIIFCAKGIIGAVISVGINKLVDYRKRKATTAATTRTVNDVHE